ncbi:mannose-ethanolamine phosphotransferase gpi13, partial [Lunasporangiospora selenospora]
SFIFISFVVPHTNLPDQEPEPYYINKLPIVNRLLETQPDNTLVFQFVADPPTTTLQRLKALTTGTLPTIIDAGSNFASSQLKEDNWLTQFEALRGRDRILFTGDDTWTNLFPTALTSNNSHSFESFDTHDLDTVDNGVIEFLGPALKDMSKWDLMIAHFLGVDHCGHAFGPNHPLMAVKLEQMNQQLERIIQAVPDDTLVVIMGDHGMSSSGDHGGDSDNEVEAGIVMYSKSKRLVNRELMKRLDLGDMLQYSKPVGGRVYRSITQIDLVPTLSLLLGLPIPYNNLGSVIPELFLVDLDMTKAVRDFLKAIRLNAAQVATYFNSYQELHPTSDIAKAMATEFGWLFDRAEGYFGSQFLDQDQDHAPSIESVVQAIRQYSDYLRISLSSCKRIWAHFEVPLMVIGGSILLASCIVLMVQIVVYRSVGIPPSLEKFIAGGTLLGLTVARHLRSILFRLEVFQESSMGLVDVMILSMASFSLVAVLACLIMNSATFAGVTKKDMIRSLRPRLPPLSGFLACLFIFVNCLIFASNSYIVHESTFVIGFLQTFGVIGLLFSLRVPDSVARNKAVLTILMFMALTRLMGASTVCREEQGKLCTPTYYASAQTTVPSQWSLVTLVASGAVTPYLIRRVLGVTKSMQGIALIWVDYGLRIGIILGTLYAVLDYEGSKSDITRGTTMNANPGNTFEPLMTPPGGQDYMMAKTMLIRIAFGFALIVGPAAWWGNPLCMDVQTMEEPVESNAGSAAGSGKRGKKSGAKASATAAAAAAAASTQGTPKKTIYVLGYANAFGASYFVTLTMLFLFVILTQKPLGAILLSLGLAQIVCLVDLVDIWRDADFALWQTDLVARIQQETLESEAIKKQEEEEASETKESKESKPEAAVAGGAGSEEAKADVSKYPSPPTLNLLLPTVVLSLMGNLFFFATGHQATLSSIQWSSGLIGVANMSFVFSPILVTVNTFGPLMLCAGALPLVVLWKLPPKADKLGQLRLFPEMTRLALMMMLHQSLVL